MRFIRSRKVVGGLALAAALASAGAVGYAQQGTNPGRGGGEGAGRHRGHGKGMRGGHGGLFGGRFAEQLNLTDAQKEQLRQIAERHRESTKALREQTRHARGPRAEAFGGTFDEAAVRAAAQARANARVELEVAHARMMSEMYNVLTPEQKAQFAAARQERLQRRQERRQRRNAPQGGAGQTD